MLLDSFAWLINNIKLLNIFSLLCFRYIGAWQWGSKLNLNLTRELNFYLPNTQHKRGKKSTGILVGHWTRVFPSSTETDINQSGQLSKFNQYFTPRTLVNFIEFQVGTSLKFMINTHVIIQRLSLNYGDRKRFIFNSGNVNRALGQQTHHSTYPSDFFFLFQMKISSWNSRATIDWVKEVKRRKTN